MTGSMQELPNGMANYSPFFIPQIPPPIVHYDDEPVTQVKFSCELIPYLIALIEILKWNDRFVGTDEERSTAVSVFEELQAALMEAYCMSVECCEIQAIKFEATFTVLHQITPNGELQVSTDGGETWSQDPKDPRIEFPVLPPLLQPGNGHTKCDAASNAIDNLKDIQSSCAGLLETGLSAINLAIDIIAIIVDIVFFGGAGLPALVGILIALTKGISDMTQDAYNAMFTEAVWDEVLCAMYCTIGEDGKFTDSQFSALMNRLNERLDGHDNPLQVSANMRAFFRVMGVGGLNNACAAGAIYDADCSDCNCTDCDLSAWTVAVGTKNTGLSNSSTLVIDAANGGDGFFYVWIYSPANDSCCCGIQGTAPGGIPFIGKIDCGVDRTNQANIGFSYAPGPGTPINSLFLKKDASFTATITGAVDCT